ncbi:MAG TPA: hypothetical protein VMU37_10680, partial [Caulobacteraceae bacterium]|nr:hypothetical protein [Caulobacteraceae bacterium]
MLLLVAFALALYGTTIRPGRAAQTLPADPALADQYLQARDDWSARTPQSLHKSMTEFGEVVSRDPTFAPAYAGLAEDYIAAHDYAGLSGSEAFPKAEAAARAALANDPRNADAFRVLGFIDYWGHQDLGAARRDFGRALQLEPASAETHFWFGSTL